MTRWAARDWVAVMIYVTVTAAGSWMLWTIVEWI